MDGQARPLALRYWGSHFKNPRHAGIFAAEIRPLVARGWRYCMVLDQTSHNRVWLQELQDLGVEFAYEPRARSNFDARNIYRVYSLARRLRPSVFHCDNMHTSPLIGAWLAGVPVRLWSKRAMSNHFGECRPPTLKERVAISTRLSCRLATCTIAVSQSVKNELIELGVPGSKVIVRLNPRKLGDAKSVIDRHLVRKEWGCSERDVVIVNVGRAAAVKGWDILLRAFAVVAKLEPRAKLVLAGSFQGDAETQFFSELQKFISEGNLSQRVLFLGHVGDIRSVLHASDIFVMPSRSEGCANALMEAIEAGLPSVATRVGHAEEVIQDGINGFLVQREDVNGMASAIQRLTTDDSVRFRFASHVAIPACIPTLEQYGEKMAVDYCSLLGHKELPPFLQGHTPVKG